MPIFKIWSVGEKKNGSVVLRTEYIDTAKNVLFSGDLHAASVKNDYEAFWKGEAKVVKIKRVKVKSKGANWGIKMKRMG